MFATKILDGFSHSAWFLKHLRPDLNYYSIEVYGESIDRIKKLISLVQNNLSKNQKKN